MDGANVKSMYSEAAWRNADGPVVLRRRSLRSGWE